MALQANAAFFSFASDADPSSWTFAGNHAVVRDAQDPLDPQVLLVDDNNGPLPQLPFNVEFQADFTISYVNSIPVMPGVFIHSYRLDGSFGFLDGSGNPLLTCTVANGAMTALGDASTWFTTSTIQVNDNPFGGSVQYTWFGAALPGYDLVPGQSAGPDDMAFTLSVINSDGMGVPLGQDHLPSIAWRSEGSYSGSARNFVPAPASAGLLGVAGFGLIRRRRSK